MRQKSKWTAWQTNSPAWSHLVLSYPRPQSFLNQWPWLPPVLTLPPLVLTLHHASVSCTLPCPVIFKSPAVFPPVTPAPWKEIPLTCTATPGPWQTAWLGGWGGQVGLTLHQARLKVIPRPGLGRVGHKPGRRGQPSAFTHSLVRAVAPAVSRVPAMAFRPSMAFRVMLDQRKRLSQHHPIPRQEETKLRNQSMWPLS